MVNLIQAINTVYADRQKPKLIVVSSMGMSAVAHKILPFGYVSLAYHTLLYV